MLHIITGLICVYLVLRLVKPAAWSVRRKCCAALILLFISQYHLFVRIAFGTLVSPEWPLAVQWVMGALFGGFILLALADNSGELFQTFFQLFQRQLTASGTQATDIQQDFQKFVHSVHHASKRVN